MLFTLKNALVAMVIMVGAIKASFIDGPFRAKATSVEPTLIVDIDITGVGELSVRSGCNKGTCPDNSAPFYFMKRFWQDYRSEHNIAWYTYNIRVNDCGQCVSKKTTSYACGDFAPCRREQNICVVSTRARCALIGKNVKADYSLLYD